MYSDGEFWQKTLWLCCRRLVKPRLISSRDVVARLRPVSGLEKKKKKRKGEKSGSLVNHRDEGFSTPSLYFPRPSIVIISLAPLPYSYSFPIPRALFSVIITSSLVPFFPIVLKLWKLGKYCSLLLSWREPERLRSYCFRHLSVRSNLLILC